MKKLLVIGDIIWDLYYRVETTRKAQEADIPVYDIVGEKHCLGGAGNVFCNIFALTGGKEFQIDFAGIGGYSDIFPYTVRNGKNFFTYVESEDQITKTRYVNDNEIISRFDRNKEFQKEFVQEFEEFIFYDPDCHIDFSDYDIVLISDYCKGTITPKIANVAIEQAGKVIVDSKREDLRMYAGAYMLNINEEEYSIQTSSNLYNTCVEDYFDFVLVTKGDKGCTLRQYDKDRSYDLTYVVHTEEFPAHKVETVDVTGCGDTHVAAVSVGLMRDELDVREAIRYANLCASIAVQNFGVHEVSKWEVSKKLADS